MEKLISSSVSQTLGIAREIAKQAGPGDIICLVGNLGAGKTHFVKGFAEEFGIDGNAVTSPTFTIINEYEGRLPIYHFDCYRLENVEQALDIGAEEYLNGTGVCLIEWPEKIEEILPAHSKRIEIITLNPDQREIIVHEQ